MEPNITISRTIHMLDRTEVTLEVYGSKYIYVTEKQTIQDVIIELELKIIGMALAGNFDLYPAMEMLRDMERKFSSEGKAY